MATLQMKIDRVHAEFVSGNAVSSTVTTHSVVSRDGSGNVHANKFKSANMELTHNAAERSNDTVFYSSDDDVIRKNTAAGMRGSLGLNNVNNTGATVAATADKIVLRDSEGDIFAAGVSIDGNSDTLFSYSDGTRSVYGGCDSNDPWFGTSSNHDLRLVTYGGERMRIDNTGNVGIGVTSPGYKLHVNGSIYGSGVTTPYLTGHGYIAERSYTFNSTSNTTKYFLGWTDQDSMQISIRDSGWGHGGTLYATVYFQWGNTPSIVIHKQSGDYTFYYTYKNDRMYLWFNNSGNSNNNNIIHSIRMRTTVGAISTTEPGSTETYASTTIGSSAATEFTTIRLCSTKDGNVGIGDTTPSYKLDVNGDINVASGKKFRMNGTALANSAMITADDANTASRIVQRDSSGNFSAGTITAALSGNASTATNADKLDDVQLDDIFNNMGGAHSNRSDFDDVPDAGCYYITGSTNGPGVNSASQYYGFTLGLGQHDPVTEGSNNGKYGCQIYWGRNVSNPYINLRYLENGAWGTWRKAAAGYADSAAFATNADKVDNLHASAFLRTDTTSSTIGRLNVSGSSTMSTGMFWKAYNYTTGYQNDDDNQQYFQVGVYVNRWVRGEGLLASSDERVKRDIQTLDTGLALSKLEKIRPVSYKMKNTGDFMFGFIGQEIEKELPNVVNLDSGTITDFNIMGEFSNKQETKYQAEDEEKDTFIYTLTLEEPIPSTFDVDKAILIEAETDGHTIQFFYDPEYCGKPEIGGTVMKLLCEMDHVKESVRYKVVGTKVNDFRSVDYNEIFTVTTAALKEVNEQLKAEKIKMATLETKYEELLKRVEAIEAL